MKWSWKLGRLAGIGVYVHWTFLLLIVYFVHLLYTSEGGSVARVAYGLLLVAAVFGCVVLHELGHALMARRFGVQTRDITLLPIGGVARLERMPENPVEELLVALAGPAVNLLIVAILIPVTVLWFGAAELADLEMLSKSFLAGSSFLLPIIVMNVFLAVFNLVPAFPMDGGRVLRALLATRLDYVRATRIAANIGQTLAVLFGVLVLLGFLGLFHANPLWLLIALFIFFGAEQESHMVRVRSMMRGVPTGAAMVTRFRTVTPDEPLSAAVQELLAGHQQDFPVTEGTRLVGMLSRRDLLAAVAQGRHDTPVGDVMRRDFQAVAEGEMLDGTFQQIREGEGSTLPVVRDGQLVGIVTLEHVGEWMTIQSALRKARVPREAAAVDPAAAREIPATPIVLPDGPAGPAPP